MFEFKNHLFVWYNDVRNLRKSKGLTQQQLAEQVGVSRQSINSIENDLFKPTAALVVKLDIVLGIFPYYDCCGWRWVSDYLGDYQDSDDYLPFD